jgi:hypothetical protein
LRDFKLGARVVLVQLYVELGESGDSGGGTASSLDINPANTLLKSTKSLALFLSSETENDPSSVISASRARFGDLGGRGGVFFSVVESAREPGHEVTIDNDGGHVFDSSTPSPSGSWTKEASSRVVDEVWVEGSLSSYFSVVGIFVCCSSLGVCVYYERWSASSFDVGSLCREYHSRYHSWRLDISASKVNEQLVAIVNSCF